MSAAAWTMADANLHEVPADRRADVALDVAHARRQQWHREHRRPPALTAREALTALAFESMVLWTAWANLRAGTDLSDADAERITLAMRRIQTISAEALQ